MELLNRLAWGAKPDSNQFEKGNITLRINDSTYTVPSTQIPPETKLVDFIRHDSQQKGTKYMCREAGCGACIVGVKRFNRLKNRDEWIAVNSCIVPIFSCSNWTIVTVEGLGQMKKGLHKIQATLTKFSGTQCGYCTPGMVMNMFGLTDGSGHTELTMEEIENSFGGNICRCTGYRSILDAFKSFAKNASEELKKPCIDIEDIMEQMKTCPKINSEFTTTLKDLEPELLILDKSFSIELQDKIKWIRVKKVTEIFSIFKTLEDDVSYMLVAGHTSHGVYRIHDISLYIDINGVDELHGYSVENQRLKVGANTSLNEFMNILKKVANGNPKSFSYLHRIAAHIDLVANVPVRNIGTIAGNLSIKHAHQDFPSDIFTVLEASGAVLEIGNVNGVRDEYSLPSFLFIPMRKRVINYVLLPAHDNESCFFTSYKIMQRAQNTPAYVNAAYLFTDVDRKNNYRLQGGASIVYSNINSKFIHAEKTEDHLYRKELLNKSTIQEACKILFDELQPNEDPLLASVEYRRSLAVNLLYKCLLSLLSSDVAAKYRSGGSLIERPLSSGKQDYQLNKSFWPVGQPLPKLEALIQCTGEAEYVDDIPPLKSELYAAVVLSKTGPAKLENIDISAIEHCSGFVRFISAKDIPGKNTFVEGNGTEMEELLVSEDIQYAGQVVGVVIATNQETANVLAEKVVVKVSGEKKAVLNLKEIIESGDKNRIIQQASKEAKEKKNDIKYRVNGTFQLGGQYHFTMETQTSYCIPTEDGIDVHASTQWATLVQQNVSAILKIPMNNVNVIVRRCGGGYGAKLGRSAITAGVCSLAAHVLRKPVRTVMRLESNMRCIGKRFPVYAKYEVAVNQLGQIQTMVIQTYHNAGAHTNDTSASGFIYFGSALYQTDTWKWTCYDVRTDISPNTFCRAPGSCEAVALIEHIMEHIAYVAKLDPIVVRLNNLSTMDKPIIPPMLADLKSESNMDARLKEVEAYNLDNRWKKRGLSVAFMDYPYTVPSKYHVLISIYAPDGTVAVTHGGVEIGQGINTKVVQVIAYKFGIDLELIKIKPTNSLTAPNDSGTGGSNASDGVTKATIECCDILVKRLEEIKKKNPNATWPELIVKANEANVDLLAESQYGPTPSTEISYNIYGICVSEVEIDLLTGQHQIRRVDLLEDVGDSMNPYVDIGQVEGAFIMGLGYWLHEKLVYDQNNGQLLSDRTWSYTPPTAKDIPVDFRVYFRRNAPNPAGVLRSKAVGEPPLCLSISIVFAIRNALAAARKDASNVDQWFDINLPYTPENILLSSLTSYQQFDI